MPLAAILDNLFVLNLKKFNSGIILIKSYQKHSYDIDQEGNTKLRPVLSTEPAMRKAAVDQGILNETEQY